VALHFLAEGASADSDLTKFVLSFKQGTAFQFAGKAKFPLWQFKYYDHILRKAEGAGRVAWYTWLNPVRKGLCRLPQDFLFSGSFTERGMRLFGSQPSSEWIPPWKEKAEKQGDATLKRGAT